MMIDDVDAGGDDVHDPLAGDAHQEPPKCHHNKVRPFLENTVILVGSSLAAATNFSDLKPRVLEVLDLRFTQLHRWLVSCDGK